MLCGFLCPDCCRNLNFLNEENEDDFDAVLADMEKEMSMADIMKELGYGCTMNVSQCKEILSLLSPVTEITVARILGTISRTYSGLEDNQNCFSTFRGALGSSILPDIPSLNSWNAEVLIESIKQLVSGRLLYRYFFRGNSTNFLYLHFFIFQLFTGSRN